MIAEFQRRGDHFNFLAALTDTEYLHIAPVKNATKNTLRNVYTFDLVQTHFESLAADEALFVDDAHRRYIRFRGPATKPCAKNQDYSDDPKHADANQQRRKNG